jgi:hypothetical protein
MRIQKIYGRNSKSTRKLQPPVELSPEKYEDSTRIEQGLDEKLSSPSIRRSPRIRALRESKDDNMFDLPSEDLSSLIESMKRSGEESKELKRKPTVDRSPKLNKFFVESQDKPIWSPKLSPKKVQKPDSDTHRVLKPRISPLTRKLLASTDRNSPSSSPKGQSTSKSSSKTSDMVSSDSWDFLNDIAEKPKPNTTLKISLRSPRKGQSDERKDLVQFFETQLEDHMSTQKDDSKDYTPDITTSSSSLPESPKVSRSKRTYGLQRSYLLEKPSQQEKDEIESYGAEDSSNDTDASDEADKSTADIKNITDLRAQGSSAQFTDELNFILEGIHTTSSLSGFLELGIKLMEPEFVKFLKSHEDLGLWKYVNDQDPSMCFVLGFIMCTIAEASPISLAQVSPILVTLLKNHDPEPKKASKMTRALFKEWYEQLEKRYTPQFLAISLMFTNDLFITNELFSICIDVMNWLKLVDPMDLKVYDMLLILFEKYLNSTDIVHPSFQHILKHTMKLDQLPSQTMILSLKLLIVLAVKKYPQVYHPALVTQAINTALSTKDPEIQLLSFGLLINLVEDDICLKKCLTHTSKLQELYTIAYSSSISYFSLLIGVIYLKDKSITDQFHRQELNSIILELEKFDKSNKVINQQIEAILTVMNS